MTERVTGQSGRKLSASGQRRAERLEQHGYTGLDDPGRPGRPRGPASLAALKHGGSARSKRRHLAAGRELLERFGIHPQQLVGTSLHKLVERQALVALPSRDAAVIVKAALRGRKVSAHRRLRALQPPQQRVYGEVAALIRLYNRSSVTAQMEFSSRLLASLDKAAGSNPD